MTIAASGNWFAVNTSIREGWKQVWQYATSFERVVEIQYMNCTIGFCHSASPRPPGASPRMPQITVRGAQGLQAMLRHQKAPEINLHQSRPRHHLLPSRRAESNVAIYPGPEYLMAEAAERCSKDCVRGY